MYDDLIGPRSMLKLAGNEHRRMRQIVTPPLVGASLRRRADTVHRLTDEARGGGGPLDDARLTERSPGAFSAPPAVNEAYHRITHVRVIVGQADPL